MSENTKKQLARAKSLIQKKKYEDALSILITVDHPIADKWINRIEKINKTTARSSTNASSSFATKYAIVIIAYLFFALPGLILNIVWAREAQQIPENERNNVPYAKAMIWTNRIAFIILATVPILFLILVLIGSQVPVESGF